MKREFLKKLLYAVSAYIVLTALVIQSPTLGQTFSYLAILMIPAALAAAVMFIATMVYDIVKKTRFSINFLLVLLVAVGCFWSGLKVVDMQIPQSKISGERIVEALNKYFAENNKYPENLSELQPKYIDDLPKSKMGIIKVNFDYKTEDGGKDYWLGFFELFKAKWNYIGSRGMWIMDD